MSSGLPRWLEDKSTKPAPLATNKYFYLPTIVILTIIIILQPWNLIGWHVSDEASGTANTISHGNGHIIHDLVAEADRQFKKLRQSETYTIGNAAKEYRERRGRHPPPGFDAWYDLARQSSTVMVEAFYDQVYEDLEPFWGIDPQELRDFALHWPTPLTIRNGKPELRFSEPNLDAWFRAWHNMTLKMPNLPDVDLALLAGDQSVVLASFQKVSRRMESANKRLEEHRSLSVNQIKRDFSARPPLLGPVATHWPRKDLLEFPEDSDRWWDYVVTACKPTDPVFTSPELVPNSSLPLVFSDTYTAGTTQGFVSNLTQSRSVCHNPNLRTLHGFMIRPGIGYFYNDLRPIFTFGKISGINNDIVIPAPANYNEGMYSGLDLMRPWKLKKDSMVWRGSATGGDWLPDNWMGFQRHRFVSLLNSTVVRQTQAEMADLANKGLPQTYKAFQEDTESSNKIFDLKEHRIQLPATSLFKHPLTGIADWLEKSVSVGFTHLFCWPFRSLGPPGDCGWVSSYFKLANFLSASEVLMHKYLPDIDGQSISARFRGFLQSTSVPLKATIFAEWHDSRLTPWRDFLPLSNEFQEIYDLLYFFIGDHATSGSPKQRIRRANWWRVGKEQINQKDPDVIGERIGQQGSEWARRVMRTEDMVLYFHRLILEYARITSDDRVVLGWVDDLLSETATDTEIRNST